MRLHTRPLNPRGPTSMSVPKRGEHIAIGATRFHVVDVRTSDSGATLYLMYDDPADGGPQAERGNPDPINRPMTEGSPASEPTQADLRRDVLAKLDDVWNTADRQGDVGTMLHVLETRARLQGLG